ncbi:MAG: sulfite exporter TauE/SafE family protein [Polynucleobacter sp.]|jgi:uncharacterized membrane protein YfcA|uniref:sulfite exporter TauE/SafE family protein n=1 Tax=Polynucleobacter sp. TaxID=2029855 RepID=UPI002726931B|nr:sulfite exporter TauE/SafE family protein [Polynucleobacter sp.]MDO9013259.1 sulfite exporter TauE/SafE family protein [Polynucleobacter sp.]MDP3122520.1 sulfite exporter TauE/SafE family protein [Polynucleobacter sp.]
MESINAVSVGLGVFVGMMMALTGAGGGILSVPLLVFGLKLSVASAGPIGLLAIAVAGSFGAINGLRTGLLRYRAALVMAALGIVLAPIGLYFAHRIPNQPLLIAFASLLMIVSARMLIQAQQEITGTIPKELPAPPCKLDQSIGRLIWSVPCARALIGSGAVAGFLSGLLGVGGGFIIVPALKKYTDLPMQSIVATSLGVLSLISIAGFTSAALAGHLNWSIGMPFAAGAMVGMLLGSLIAKQISGPRIQQAFAIFTFLISISLLYKAIE